MNPRNKTHNPLIVLCFFTSLLVIAACGRNDGRFRLTGQFKNLNQGEFYLYSLENGTKDTIVVNDGRFTYERAMRDTATLVLLFPNYSELPIFARPDAKVSIEGDVSHLRETTVSGTDENDAMTAFRKKTNDMMPPDVQKAAADFIARNAASPVSVYLLRRYFLQAPTPDYPQAFELCTMLHEAQPQNIHLTRLHLLLEGMKDSRADGDLQSFSAVDTKGDTITNKQLKSDVNVILTWASWDYDTQETLRQLATFQKDHPRRLSVVSISMDASPSEGKSILERDSIQWPNICDSLMWQSPLLAQLGIATLPANILVDKEGHIKGRNLNGQELTKQMELLLE